LDYHLIPTVILRRRNNAAYEKLFPLKLGGGLFKF
jgi:hypothetical protein